MSVIEAKALFRARSQYASQAEAALHVRHTRPVQIKQLIDALPHPTALFDTASRMLYLNRRLTAMLKHDPQSDMVLKTLREAGSESAKRKDEHIAQVTTVAGRYKARAIFLSIQLIGSGDSVLVSVEANAEVLPTSSRLRMQFGVTEQEARVALLLAKRLTTDEIATQLTITRNTVRRHIERVLAKLEVNNRTDVRDRMMSMQRNRVEHVRK